MNFFEKIFGALYYQYLGRKNGYGFPLNPRTYSTMLMTLVLIFLLLDIVVIYQRLTSLNVLSSFSRLTFLGLFSAIFISINYLLRQYFNEEKTKIIVEEFSKNSELTKWIWYWIHLIIMILSLVAIFVIAHL